MALIIWLLPIVFMFHDFEEILLLMAWVEKNRPYLKERFPKLAPRILSHFNTLTYSGFCLIVAEEFLVVSFITVITVLYHTYWLWFTAFMGFTVHLLVHIIQWLVIRRYIPVVITSFLSLPYCGYALTGFASSGRLTGPTILFASIFGLSLVILNYLFATWLAQRFSRWQRKYQSATG